MYNIFVRMLGPAHSRSGVSFLGVGLIDASGTGLYLAGSALFFTTYVGLSAVQVGVGLAVAGGVGLLAQPLVGKFADRVGAKNALALINVYRAVGFLAYVFADDFVTFVLIAAAIGIAEVGVPAVYQALAEEMVGTENRMGMMARMRVGFNVGLTLGGLLASLAILIGTREAYAAIVVANAFSFLVAATLLSRLHLTHERTRTPAGRRRLDFEALRDPGFMSLAVVNGLLALHMSMLFVGVPLWISQHTSAPDAVVGLVLVVNTIMAVLLQVWVSKGTDTDSGGAAALRKAGLWLVGSCALLALSGTVESAWAAVPVIFVAVAALTMGELYQSVGGWGLSYAISPERSRAEFLATFNLGVGAQNVIGPLLITGVVLAQGPVGWLILASGLLVVLVLVGPALRTARRRADLRNAGERLEVV